MQPINRAGGRITGQQRFALMNLIFLLTCFSVLRLILYFSFGRQVPTSGRDLLLMFGYGFLSDVGVGLSLLLPFLLVLLVFPGVTRGRWSRLLWWCGIGFLWSLFLFVLVVEYYFFEEFNARFNTVAVDYLLYPYEVFVNIWEAYPVVALVGGCAAAGVGMAALGAYLSGPISEEGVGLRRRLLRFAAVLAVAGLALTFGYLRNPRFSADRVINETANNGLVSFVNAALTRDLDFQAFYATLEPAEAYARTRKLLTRPGQVFEEPHGTLQRRVMGDSGRPRLNVVILLEESLGSEFWGCLGRPGKSLTPEMDRIALTEGILFTNFYACGNRTVRGLEGVLCSFPPLPGDSIIVRAGSENVETVARVFKRDGYVTEFLYGGRGIFDGMRSFMLRNGYDRFIERKDFPNPTFTTVWGVCDEDLYARAVEDFARLDREGKPFFATLLSVSNHKPFTYPPGRIPEDPKAKSRNHAVQYADYALGQFFKAAREKPFYTNTIFAVVADHGARVYGSQDIPIKSYEIPFVIVGPAVVQAPRQVGNYGCSLDVAPTILGLIGRPYRTLFFGQDILKEPVASRLVMHHNRDIGLFKDNRMAVLGLNKTVEFYEGNPKGKALLKKSAAEVNDNELSQDAQAIFQTADALYISHRFSIEN